MPYIKQEDRKDLKSLVEKIGETPIQSVGHLNYLVTMLCQEFLSQHPGGYRSINGVVGALECAKLEFYRRLATPYEDGKIAEHGDVY